ncbi:MarR family winged helix-turn-helix transcriptional regulator [Corynebacterium bouchesdurhonense]|uniref:MarR family winged helix-turn-helix transcriptional regulator n=1 Tax=Corynebacterium bouchesdurhonense TaxID=1720192 RepID=UPI00292A3CB3|nr:MarR family transcriptional regulator [Corynebacterium bouchesdurhonense]
MTKIYVAYFRTAEHSALSGPQLSVLQRLDEFGPSRIRQLAEAEGVRMPTASNTINQLERAGLVSRERALDDRRGVMVQITDLGRQRLELVGEERTKFLAEMFATLDDANLEHISEVTDAIDALANAYTQRPEPRAAL